MVSAAMIVPRAAREPPATGPREPGVGQRLVVGRSELGATYPDCMARWQPGDQFLLREVHRGSVWAARPAVVVEDTAELTALYLPPGMRWKRPVASHSLAPLRMPAQQWRLDDATLAGARTLYLTQPGVANAVHLWWVAPDWRFDSWYVNLQEEVRRTPLGFDYLDQMLDIVVAPDLSSWALKDEDELVAACEQGLLTAEAASAILRRTVSSTGSRLVSRRSAIRGRTGGRTPVGSSRGYRMSGIRWGSREPQD